MIEETIFPNHTWSMTNLFYDIGRSWLSNVIYTN